jgi:hypothetical protein
MFLDEKEVLSYFLGLDHPTQMGFFAELVSQLCTLPGSPRPTPWWLHGL